MRKIWKSIGVFLVTGLFILAIFIPVCQSWYSPKYGKDYQGLSTETKPTSGVRAGSTFLELDTSKVSVYNGTTWYEIDPSWWYSWNRINFSNTEVNATTKITDLNADLLDGKSEEEFGDLSENETISGNWVNTTNPWADNEVANDLTIDGGSINNSPIGATIPSPAKFGDSLNYIEFDHDGGATLHGNARDERHLEIDISRFKLGGINDPIFDSEGIFITLDFADGTDDEAFATDRVPFRWDESTDITVMIDWFSDTDASDKVAVWCVDYISLGDNETVNGSVTAISHNCGGAGAGKLQRSTFTTKMVKESLTSMDTWGIRLWRDGDNVNDTLEDEARFVQFHIHFIQNKFGGPVS